MLPMRIYLSGSMFKELDFKGHIGNYRKKNAEIALD